MIRLILFITLTFLSLVSFSQDQQFQSRREKDKNKPTLFHNHADTSDVHPNFFNTISSVEIGDKITIQVMQNLIIKGNVNIIEETIEYRKVSVESEETPGLRIILSHNIEDEYIGFISCTKHKDMLVLHRDETTSKYMWIKREVGEILPD